MKTVHIEKLSLYLLICKSVNTYCKANRERNRIVHNSKRMPKDKTKLKYKKYEKQKETPAV